MGLRSSDRRAQARLGRASTVALVGLALAAPAAASQTVYVANDGSGDVTPIDTATNVAGLPIAVGVGPIAVAITPDGKTAYVANEATNNVTPIDTATNLAQPPIPVGAGPSAIAIAPDGRTAYVTNSASDSVTPIDVATNAPGLPIAVGSRPFGIAVSPDGKHAYVTNFDDDDVSVLDLSSNTVVATIHVGAGPLGVAITPNGATVYTVNLSGEDVTPIDTATDLAAAPIDVGLDPNYMAITPDGKTAYVGIETPFVIPFDIATGVVGADITVGAGGAEGISITPDGTAAYFTQPFTNAVSLIDTATNTVSAPIGVGALPVGLAITPSQAPVAAFNGEAAHVGQPASFNASASHGEGAPIATYDWEFGDGSSASSSSPTTTHVYAAAGTYSVRLTVTNEEGCSTAFIFTGQTALCDGSGAASALQSIAVSPRPAAPASQPPRLIAPIVSHLVARPKCVTNAHLARVPSSGAGGLAFAYTLNEAANVRYVIMRRDQSAGRSRCGPAAGRDAGSYSQAGSASGEGASGQNSVSLGTAAHAAGARSRSTTGAQLAHAGLGAGRHGVTLAQITGGKALAPGTYVLMVRATNAAGQRSNDADVKFFVLSR